MKYDLTWTFNKDYQQNKIFFCECKLKDHPTVKSFTFSIQEKGQYKSKEGKSVSILDYGFGINTKTDRTGTEKPYYNPDKTRQIQFSVKSLFSHLGLEINSWSDPTRLNLLKATKDSTIACAKTFFPHLSLTKDDQDKILEFLETGIFTHQQVFEKILTFIYEQKIQQAFDEAVWCEKKGYKGILYQIGQATFDLKHFQPAYVIFSSVPASDPNYIKAQLAAAKLAALPQVPFKNEAEKYKAVFTHCQNAGKEGQLFIDNFFKNATHLNDSEEYEIKNVQTNFETLVNLANIIAQQQDEIMHLRQKLSAYADKNAKNNFSFLAVKNSAQKAESDSEQEQTDDMSYR